MDIIIIQEWKSDIRIYVETITSSWPIRGARNAPCDSSHNVPSFFYRQKLLHNSKWYCSLYVPTSAYEKEERPTYVFRDLTDIQKRSESDARVFVVELVSQQWQDKILFVEEQALSTLQNLQNFCHLSP